MSESLFASGGLSLSSSSALRDDGESGAALDAVDDDDDVVVPIPSLSRAPLSSLPWVERYRPRQLSDVSHQEEVVATLRKACSTANVRHSHTAADNRGCSQLPLLAAA